VLAAKEDIMACEYCCMDWCDMDGCDEGDPEPVDDTLYCSFCGASQKDVGTLIAGPAVYICRDCVNTALDLLDGRRAGAS
jgi:hypothetical protein